MLINRTIAAGSAMVYCCGMRKLDAVIFSLLLAGCAPISQRTSPPLNNADAAFDRLAEEYVEGYLAWRPQTGTALGFHQYDGKVTDLSRRWLDAELARLKLFGQRLTSIDPSRLSEEAARDYRLLRSAIKREIFGFEQMQVHSRNPMTYASLVVTIYL